MKKSSSNNLRSVVRQILAQSVNISTTVQVGASLGLLMLGSAAARADDVPCTLLPSGSGKTCLAQITGAPGDTPGTGDSEGNGHNGGPGTPNPTDTLTFTQTDPIQLVDLPVGKVGYAPLNIQNTGGAGGDGYHADTTKAGKTGGDGGTGAQAGDVQVTVGSGVSGVSSGANNTPALLIASQGGAGGGSGLGSNLNGTNGTAGVGGNGGAVSGTVDGTWSAGGAARSALIESVGGEGGFGGAYRTGLSASGGNANTGGNAGTVTLSLVNTQSVSPDTNYQYSGSGGVLVQSVGGAGGQGGGAEQGAPGSTGGNGGAGGNGNVVNLTVGPNVTIQAAADNDAALHVLSQGGAGGAGGSGGGTGGTAGAGGNASDVALTFQPGSTNYFDQIVSKGASSPGVLVQSLGGGGGGGGSASWGVVGPNGGDGGSGGTPGKVAVTGGSVGILTGTQGQLAQGELSIGVLAQSIGGGGGSGSVTKGLFATGGNGGNAVAGNDASVDLTSGITTYGFRADGISVQSIGGGGGVGGEAFGDSLGLQAVVGGTGGLGGAGGTAELTSEAGSSIVTFGDHASGLVVQSIGGGGGNGGAAYSGDVSALIGVDISVGGTGGKGGDGSTVGVANQTTNAGTVATFGSDSFGILAQSIGGGGGVGGAATAKAKVYGNDDLPSASLTEAIGGNGGAGGIGNSVTLGNTGMVSTSGAGATGIVGQSIGGGGGAGGDAAATSSATKGMFNLAASVAIGGQGNTGGDGGTVNATNSGLVVTLGESADGLLVQSIGGGGGIGGSGDAKASSSSGELNLSTTLAMGGNGGGAGDGHSVTATNSGGSIITLGDGAVGIAAQSIGGGGGSAGGGAGSTKGDFTASYTVGGQGGGGGSTYNVDQNGKPLTVVTVNNTAGSMVMTYGADATGILAQSIGGGGGDGGKSATTLGKSTSTGDGGNSGSASGPNPNSNPNPAIVAALADFTKDPTNAVNNYNTLSGAQSFVTSLLSSGSSVSASADDDSLDDLAQSGGQTNDDNQSTKIHLQVALGGSGGNGGSAGAIQVNNAGTVVTLGAASDGVVAQAVGGGGGKGGAASTATSNDYSGSLDVGGTGGAGGNGGQPVVTNTGSIITEGSLSSGIVAQSIGGGGGIGGISAASTSSSSTTSGATGGNGGAFKNIPISVGGNGEGGISGTSGQVYVTSSGAIATTAHDSSGIIAQSIAGGGGIVTTLATDLEKSGGSSSKGETDYDIDFNFGGKYGSAIKVPGEPVQPSGSSGLVNVTTQKGGTITTQGDDSYGILAQSVAGGGGLALGGQPIGTSGSDFFGSGLMYGSVTNDGVNNPTSGNSGVFVEAGDNITTSGKGAVGILAQSIGGGGGLAGDTGATEQYSSFGSGTNHNGNGGYVGVTVDAGATVSTSGANAPAVFVQSIGGGGGRVTNSSGAYIGTAGGTGTGGAIDVNINGTLQATGAGSGGVFAQSEGDSTSQSPINVTVGSTGKIIVGQSNVATAPNGESAGIYIDHGGTTVGQGKNAVTTQNTVTNNGLIQTYGSGTNAVAVYSTGGNTNVINNGTMAGDVLLTNGGGTGCFTNNGTFNSGDKVTVGACGVTNTGTINVGSAGAIGTTTISGDYVQQSQGKLNIDADLKNGNADVLAITGKANIAGVVDVNALTVSNRSVTVLTATGGVTVDPKLKEVDNSALFDFPVVASGNELDIKPTAHFTDAAANLDASQKKMASYLQQLFDGGASLDDGFTALSKISPATASNTYTGAGNNYAASLSSMSGEALGSYGAFRVNSSRAFAEQLYGGCQDLSSEGRSKDSCSWAKIFGGSMDQDAEGDTAGYHASAYTIEVGGEVGLTDHLALVGSIGSEKSQFQGDDQSGQISGSAAVAGVGLNYAYGPWELSGALDSAYGWYRSTRIVTVGDESGTADANPRQWQMGLHLHSGYSFALSNTLYAKPFVDAHAIRVTDEAFTEEGTSPFRLAVDGRTDTTWLAQTGVEFGAHLPLTAGAILHPYVSAAAEFNRDQAWTTAAHFADVASGPDFSMATAGPGTLGRFVLGADLIHSDHLSFSLAYEPEVGRGYSAQAGTVRFSYTF
jgi:hypothetical protein